MGTPIAWTRIMRRCCPAMSSRYPTEPTPQFTSWPKVAMTSTGQPSLNSRPKISISGRAKIMITNASGR